MYQLGVPLEQITESSGDMRKVCSTKKHQRLHRKQILTVREDDMDGKQPNNSQELPEASFPFQEYP